MKRPRGRTDLQSSSVKVVVNAHCGAPRHHLLQPNVQGRRFSDRVQVPARDRGSGTAGHAKARNPGALNAEQARYEYTNLMRWRLEKVLGYKHTHTLEVKNTSGAYLYNLIFATDNPTGDKIMGDIYGAALARNEKMRLEAAEIRREQSSGQARLFGLDLVEGPAIDSDLAYVHEPPTPPYGAKASDDNG